ncbi:MAG: glycosyltransferase [Elusimicrobiota bacterium]
MILHLFNSSVVSGPERLVLPALAEHRDRFMIVNLREERLESLRRKDPLQEFSRSLGLRYTAVPVHARWDRGAISRLRDVLKTEKPELVHAHVGKASIYLAQCLFSMKERPPIVSTHHGVGGLPDLKTRLYEILYRWVFLRFFDRVLCVSTEDYEILKRSAIGASRLKRHLNGLDGILVKDSARLEARRGIRASWLPNEPDRDALLLLGVVGRLSAEKDHLRILRILAQVEKNGGALPWRCLIFGSGDMEKILREEAGRLGLDHRIEWMGYRDAVGKEMAGLDLLLSFSKAEGLPINLIEAGWAGTPVMCTWVGGIKDLIPDDSYGLRIDLHESVDQTASRILEISVKDKQACLQAMGRRLQSRVAAEFSTKRWLSELRTIYAELNVHI